MGGAREGDVIDATPRAWLAAGHLPAAQRAAFEHAMKAPWCWPADDALAEAARAFGATATAAPAVGEVLLVSVAASAPRTALWRLSWNDRHAPVEAPFRADAHASLVRAGSIAPRVAPHLHTLRPLDHPPRGAAQVFKRGPHADHVLDDVSFGVSFVFAAVSALTDRPVPPRFVATAALDADGALRPVAGLADKLSLVADAALAVDTVLVAASQRDEARAVAATLARPLAVWGVSTAEEAVARMFDGADKAAPGAWDDERRARAVADALFTLCREGNAVTRWRAVERAAAWLTGRFAASSRWGVRVRFAAHVAARHANAEAVAMHWEHFVTPGGDHPFQMAAHVLQAAADAGLDELPAYVDRAQELLPDEPDEPGAIELLGALGRALAALRRYDGAATALAYAARAWFDTPTPHEASYPLAEWLRVAAVAGDARAWAEAVATTDVYLAQVEGGHHGRRFVRAALAHGYGLRGEADRVLAELDGPAWSDAPAWLVRSTRRLRAQALDALGRGDEAEALRRSLAEDDDDRAAVEAAFAALDATLARGDDPAVAVEAVLATRPQGVRWLLEGAATADERARRLAREYPY